MQIFEEEEAKKPVEAPVQTNVESSTMMVLEVAAVAGAAGPEPLAKHSIALVKEESTLRCQPTQGTKKLLPERLRNTINRKLVWYLTLEEAKANIKSKKKKKMVIVVE